MTLHNIIYIVRKANPSAKTTHPKYTHVIQMRAFALHDCLRNTALMDTIPIAGCTVANIIRITLGATPSRPRRGKTCNRACFVRIRKAECPKRRQTTEAHYSGTNFESPCHMPYRGCTPGRRAHRGGHRRREERLSEEGSPTDHPRVRRQFW